MPKELKIAVITQNDEYAIPRNLKLLCESKSIKISELIVISSTGSFENKKWLFVSGFGIL